MTHRKKAGSHLETPVGSVEGPILNKSLKMVRKCRICNKEYKPSSGHLDCPQCRGKQKKTKICPTCKTKMHPYSKLCRKCATIGENNNNYKGGRVKHSSGYIYVRVDNHPRATRAGYVFEHIVIMEKFLGRSLDVNETIHHKNGVKADNRPENLELWSGHHPSGQRVSDLVVWAKEILEKYND